MARLEVIDDTDPGTATVYLVYWREYGVLKVGRTRTRGQRVALHRETGAELLYELRGEPMWAEAVVLRMMRQRFPRAFDSRAEAVDFLYRGRGYTESFLVDEPDALLLPLECIRVVERNRLAIERSRAARLAAREVVPRHRRARGDVGRPAPAANRGRGDRAGGRARAGHGAPGAPARPPVPAAPTSRSAADRGRDRGAPNPSRRARRPGALHRVIAPALRDRRLGTDTQGAAGRGRAAGGLGRALCAGNSPKNAVGNAFRNADFLALESDKRNYPADWLRRESERGRECERGRARGRRRLGGSSPRTGPRMALPPLPAPAGLRRTPRQHGCGALLEVRGSPRPPRRVEPLPA